MSRTLVVVVAAAALAVALPSFAIEAAAEVQTDGQQQAAPSSGGGVAGAFYQASEAPATVPHERYATGQVVMTTPSELVIHTKKGMEEFTIPNNASGTTTAYRGEHVTVGYVPRRGSVQVAAAPVMAARPLQRAVVAEVEPPAPEKAWHSSGTAAAVPAPAAAAAPAATPAKAAPPARRLPKTASDQPLLLVTGLLGIVAAGSLRLARTA